MTRHRGLGLTCALPLPHYVQLLMIEPRNVAKGVLREQCIDRLHSVNSITLFHYVAAMPSFAIRLKLTCNNNTHNNNKVTKSRKMVSNVDEI